MSRGPSPDAAKERAPKRAQAPRIDREGAGTVALQLAIGREGVGLELARRASYQCLDIVELVVRLPHVRFPFDVTGGVARFRHKRGELLRIAIELDARRAARWAEPRLRGLVAIGSPSVVVDLRRFGATVTISARPAARAGEPPRTDQLPTLVFELGLLPSDDDVVLVVHGARGAHLPAPPTMLAIRGFAALIGPSARREGARFVWPGAGSLLARHMLPDAGVRAPSGLDVALVGSGESDGVLFVQLAKSGALADVPDGVTRAHEAALLARDGDDARFNADLDAARHHDLVALERAPRHPELARRIAEIDRSASGRAEAAAALLRESEPAGVGSGSLLGDLLVEAGDVRGAVASLLSAAEQETSNALAALLFARAAELAESRDDASSWLDLAVSRAPRIAELHWARAACRLAAGRLADARADYQQLEAMAKSPRDRHEVLTRAADAYRTKGLGIDAASLYERALLYRPEDPTVLAGLGAALAAEGRGARGAALLAQAIALASAKRMQTAWMELELGSILGEKLEDPSAAVSRLRAIPDEAPEAISARGLEGRLRAKLGDFSGASLAFARLRERSGREPAAVPWLVEAASFEATRGDLLAAQRHAATALSILPRREDLRALARDLGERVAWSAGMRPAPPPDPVAAGAPEPAAAPLPAPLGADPALSFSVRSPSPSERIPSPPPSFTTFGMDDDEGDDRDAELEARVEILTQRLHGDPTNDQVIDELAIALTKLGRGMELLALLSARLEDAPLDRREELLPRHREVLARLEADARAAGREAEADLFKMAREVS